MMTDEKLIKKIDEAITAHLKYLEKISERPTIIGNYLKSYERKESK